MCNAKCRHRRRYKPARTKWSWEGRFTKLFNFKKKHGMLDMKVDRGEKWNELSREERAKSLFQAITGSYRKFTKRDWAELDSK